MILKGAPEHLRSGNGPEFVTKDLRRWLADTGAKTPYLEPGSPWGERLLRIVQFEVPDEFPNPEIPYPVKELRVPAER